MLTLLSNFLSPMIPTDNTTLYRNLYLIRRFEESVLENFPKGVFFGTTHTYLGQEANAVGVLAHLNENDIVFSNHRCHGHFLAYGGDLRALFAEMMGRATGVCGGRGGSQHLQWKNFYSNGVQGGIVPIATGMALAEKHKLHSNSQGNQTISVVFLGDGTLGEGTVYEALNLAGLWGAPVLYVVENNRIAQTTPIEQSLAGDISTRFTAFSIPAIELDSSDVLEILTIAGQLLDEVRSQNAPRALILHTCRFGPHSKGDDTRPAEYIDHLRQQRDPLLIHATRLTLTERQAIEVEINNTIDQAFRQALEDPFPAVSELSNAGVADLSPIRSHNPLPSQSSNMLEALNQALHQAMKDDARVVLLGEDILDPYGGAFKICKGLSSAFPGRVLTTPISEAGFTGLATGMALRGLRPVVEIMFGDFITLIADQVINHAAKFHWMYSGGKSAQEEITVPLVIRTPMGGRRGYGPTHSQTLEKHFMGVPGLRIIAPTHLGDPGLLLYETILNTQDPVLFIENKLLYLLPLNDPKRKAEFEVIPKDRTFREPAHTSLSYTVRLRGAPPPMLTLATYGYMTELALQSMLQLAYEYELIIELIVPTQLAPFELDAILDSTERTQRLLAIEEGTISLGWGAEVLAQAAQRLGGRLLVAQRVAGLDLPIPSSAPLEAAMLPGVEKLVSICVNMVNNSQNHNQPGRSL